MATPSPELFEQVPKGFFGPLSGPLAGLYWSVLARFYEYEFEREPFFLLRETALEIVESLLPEAKASPEGERQTARRVLERLEEAGWVHFEYRSSVGGSVLNFRAEAARMMEVLMRTARQEQPIFQGYAHSIATLLKPDAFAASPGVALVEARRHTLELVRELKILNRNMQSFTQRVLDEARSAAAILEQGVDRYHSAVMSSYHQLKTVDNLFKWRTRVLDRLDQIMRDETRLEAAAAWLAEQLRIEPEEARRRIDQDLHLMFRQFESLPEITDDLDQRNAKFSGVALRKLMYFLRQDRRAEAQLQFLVDQLASSDEIEIELPVYRCELLADGFLYTPRKQREVAERQRLEQHVQDPDAVRRDAATRVRRKFGRKRMEERLAQLLEGRDELDTRDLPMGTDDDYVAAIYAAAYGLDGRSPFRFEPDDGEVVQRHAYRIPSGRFVRKRRLRRS